MLETKDLIIDKAKYSDWEAMYKNVWSRPESAKYMMWSVTTSEDDAKVRILKTIEFQKSHDTYFVYEKKSGMPIGFAGVEKVSENIYTETGICLGPNYVNKGYGKQIVKCLIEYCKKLGVIGFASMEQRMGCGVGACLVCSVKVLVDGKEKLLRACADGPVFPLEDIVL